MSSLGPHIGLVSSANNECALQVCELIAGGLGQLGLRTSLAELAPDEAEARWSSSLSAVVLVVAPGGEVTPEAKRFYEAAARGAKLVTVALDAMSASDQGKTIRFADWDGDLSDSRWSVLVGALAEYCWPVDLLFRLQIIQDYSVEYLGSPVDSLLTFQCAADEVCTLDKLFFLERALAKGTGR